MLCASCIGYNEDKTKYYASDSNYGCLICDSISKESIKLVGILLFFFIYVAIIVM